MKLRITLVAALSAVGIQLTVPAANQPNIILIMADDMGYSDIGCYGGEIDTPNIDRLAAEGMRFRQFYNNAKCTTTRASLMSGLYPQLDKKGKPFLSDDMLTLPQAMKLAGYRTILSGKWHLGNSSGHLPIDRGFDESYGLFDGCCNFFDPARPIPTSKKKKVRWFGRNRTRITEFPADFYATDAFTDHALNEIRQAVAADQPYFLHLAYTAPHFPLHAKPVDIEKYKGRYAAGWAALRKERHQRMIELGIIAPDVKLSDADPEATAWTGRAEDQRLMEVYAAMIDCMDQNIGRVLSLLDETGTAENTVIFFLSDNGASAEDYDADYVKGAEIGSVDSYRVVHPSWANAQNTPFRKFKLNGHEGGICTPFIVRWPGNVQAGSWNDSVAHIIDIEPTLMKLAGLDPNTDVPAGKRPLEGEVFLAAFSGERIERSKPFFMEFKGNRAVRDGDWKAAYFNKTKKWELFNLAQDRSECVDLAADYPEKLKALTGAWDQWAEKHGRTGKKK
ncbi:arylsulfatase [Pontiella agarivorans]|uniref:Arylsulfatase n=1 Tax=Pontiella agarivorans TaxID=3038953 RepID=A0ABU5MS45_9BACT|nr:arylsulfatase [Pontiella agarivorans]MDZ8117025.1 arylsulfatase [Pontiella agarivorans]